MEAKEEQLAGDSLPQPPHHGRKRPLYQRLFKLNFYRIHWLFFTIHPLIWSGIFYGCNGEFDIPYIDCLFLCFSAQTVTGLSSVNLSSLTGFQQAILFWCVRNRTTLWLKVMMVCYRLMVTGDATTVSWVMVLVRRCVPLIQTTET